MVWLLSAIACAPLGPWSWSDDAGSGFDADQRIAVSNGAIDFGEVSASRGEVGREVITVYNLGDDAVIVTGQDQPLGDGAFAIEAPPLMRVEPGASVEMAVVFAPATDGEVDAELVLDPGGQRVALHGDGLAPVVDVSPLDLGAVVVGCSASAQLPIHNLGHETLLVSGLYTDSADFSIDSFPGQIAPGETGYADVRFAPGGGDARSGEVALFTNDPLRPQFVADVYGLGDDGAGTREHFDYTGQDPTDVLLVVAGDEQTSEFLPRASDAVDALVGALRDGGTDYHLAAVTGDNLCELSSPGWTSWADSEANSVSATRAGLGGGPGDLDDDLLGLALDVLDETGLDGCMPSFRRPDAQLAVVVVSASAGSGNVTSEVGQLRNLTTTADALTVSAFVPTSAGCGGYAHDYALAVSQTKGALVDLCTTDWSAGMATIASLADSHTGARFALAEAPVEDTVVVEIEGVEATGWTFDRTANAVVFPEGDAPPWGADVEVVYVPATRCSDG